MKSTVMEKIIKLNTIKDYNDFLGIETPHSLVSVIDASKIKPLHHAIDRYSASIIASHIELLLNYCVRFCSQ